MVQNALKQANQPQLEKPRKAAQLLAKTLNYPISGGRAANSGVVSLSYGLICGSELGLGNIKHLINGMNFSLRKHLGLQRFSDKKYYKVLNMVLANLRRAHLEGCGLSIFTGHRQFDWNNPERIRYTLPNNIIDYLADKGFIHVLRGNGSQDIEHRSTTVCWPTAQLVALFEINRIKPLLHARAELIELRHKVITYTAERVKVTRNKPVKILKKDKKKADSLAEPVLIYNKLWLNHTPTLEGSYLIPWTKRVFNETLDYGGRFYGSFQQLSKQQRSKILIDGFSTVEPDYSGYHINLLYTWQDEQLDLEEDAYAIKGFSRDLVKAVMLPLLNCEKLSNLAGQITKSSKPEMKLYYERWQRKQAVYAQRVSLGLRSKQPKKKGYLKGFIEGIPEGTNGKEVIEAIKKKHPRIARLFGTKDIGVKLQKQDSEIMAAVLCKLAVQGIPALPIHDSLRVKTINELQVVEIMKSEYERITGFKINVSK